MRRGYAMSGSRSMGSRNADTMPITATAMNSIATATGRATLPAGSDTLTARRRKLPRSFRPRACRPVEVVDQPHARVMNQREVAGRQHGVAWLNPRGVAALEQLDDRVVTQSRPYVAP